ncbi:MAG: alpha/beta fold hydrolase [Gammaproteobacteria bacterium]
MSGIFDFEGQRIRYGVLGEGSSLVLLHGTPFSSVVWRRIASYLATNRRVFYFDLLGYGRSEMRQGQDVSLGIQNLVFAALLDHWGLERPDVVAHDFGGTTALRTHLLNGRDYRSLTLIDPVAIGPSGSALVQHAKHHEQTFAGLPAYIHAAILRAYIGGAVHRTLSADEMRLNMEPWLGVDGQSAFYRQIAQMDDRYTDEVEARYGEIRCPVTIIWGEQDAWIPYERGQTLAERIPNASFRLISGASHLVQEDAPEAIVATVLDFLPKAR